MTIAATILSLLLAAALTSSAIIKFTRRQPYVDGYLKVGVPEERLNQLALVLLAGAAGLVIGIFWAPIGIAAAACLVVYFGLAIAAHIRADDAENLPTPLLLALLSAAVLVLRIADL